MVLEMDGDVGESFTDTADILPTIDRNSHTPPNIDNLEEVNCYF